RKELPNAQEQTLKTPIAWIPRREKPPPYSNPPSVAKTPTSNVPSTPQTPCTATAPTGSSTFNFLSRSSIANMTAIPQVIPMITDPPGLTIAHPAVTPTKPASAPFKLIEISGLPYRIHVSIIAVTRPAAADRFVFTIMAGTLKTLSPLMASSEPPLNPNQPIQSI